MKKLAALLVVLGVSVAVVIGISVAKNGSGSAQDWLIPKIEIDGVEYTFPMEAEELVKNGWVMDENFSVPARPGSNALIIFTKDNMELFTNVSSTTGKEQPIEKGEVCSIVYGNTNSNKDVPMAFPGGITLGMSKAEVEKNIPEEFEYDDKYHCFKYVKETEQGKLDIEIQMTDDDSEVKEIHYTCWTK